MNELFAADPLVCAHASDLKLLLASFGPFTGRYLANYPTNWGVQVEKLFENVGEVEGAKILTLLRRARESNTLVTRANLLWDSEKEWLANAEPFLSATPPVFDGLVARQTKPPTTHQLHELDLPPTADERIAGSAAEYARISKILLLLSPEIVLVDPYLNPLKSDYFTVLKALFELAAKGKSQKITLWARASKVLTSGNPQTIKTDLEERLRQLTRHANFKPGRGVEMVLVDDESRQTKMHGRYLLSIRGGVRLDQGFQRLPEGRQVDVGPVGKTVHGDLLDIYFDGKHDMKIAMHLILKL